MRFFYRAFFMVALSQVPGIGGAQSTWTLEADEDGVLVYVRPEADEDMSVRVEATAAATVADVKAVLDDCASYPEWVHRCAEAYVVPGGTPDEFIYYSHIDLPFPFSDKEVVARIRQRYDEAAGAFSRTIVAEPTALPVSKGRDRLTKYDAQWEVTANGSGRVVISCTVRTSAGSGLPTWLRTEIMTGGPAKTVTNLVARLEGRAR